MEEWTSKDVETWFEKSEDFNSLKDKFKISGKDLASLSEQDIQQECGSALYDEIQSLRENQGKVDS